MKNKFSILVPTYNEIDNIKKLIKKISDVLKKNIFEIIVIDDNSQDGTKKVLYQIKKKNIKFRYIIRKNINRDLSKSIILGIK